MSHTIKTFTNTSKEESTKSMFYFLRQDILHDTNTVELVGHNDATAELPWFEGVRFDKDLPPKILQFDSSYGSQLPDIFDTSIPIMSTRLLNALIHNGVSNIDSYPIQIKDNKTGENHDNYHAVNVLSLIDGIDATRSPHRSRFGRQYYEGSIFLRKLSEPLPPLFRLASGPALIVVRDDLMKVIEGEGFVSLLLQPLSDYTGD